MKKLYNVKSIIFVCILMTSCNYKPPFGWPTPNNYMNKAPDGPPAFQYGWSQGCDTGGSAWRSQFYINTSLSYFQKDFKFANESPDYELGWQIGFWYCLRASDKQDGFNKDKYAGI